MLRRGHLEEELEVLYDSERVGEERISLGFERLVRCVPSVRGGFRSERARERGDGFGE